MKYLLVLFMTFSIFAETNTYHICWVYAENGKLLKMETGYINVVINNSVTILEKDTLETVVNGGTVICTRGK